MTQTWQLLLIWLAACVIAVIAGFGLLNIMVQDTEISYATELPRSVVTVPMICVIVFWGVVRAAGVLLEPVRTFTFGGLAVYLALFVVGRVLVSVAIDPVFVLVLVLVILMTLGWIAIRGAARAMPQSVDRR
ncbi:hypothetical protein AN189_13750 [Loktanella sp. 3ANDIMAR09]|uniref:hypothetical protein n=1 Tax=Loktanella sp. 3ANDIMAR09 TaxID=1225657 RepID=UPI0006FD5693|nr:hypothetical protein [Loktanella sp. 3ANDIMAR09]KQI67837.1 hypothetical protein AN189_13750 [Loktanella sp. 3ANDIMAR09]